jgi:hypothetical protein
MGVPCPCLFALLANALEHGSESRGCLMPPKSPNALVRNAD